MDQFENNLWSAPAKADKLRLLVLGQLQLRPRRRAAASPRLTATFSGPSGSQGLGRLWNRPR